MRRPSWPVCIATDTVRNKQIVGLFKSLGCSGTPDNCEWRPHGRVQVQLRARTACLACSTISMVFEWFSGGHDPHGSVSLVLTRTWDQKLSSGHVFVVPTCCRKSSLRK